MKTLKEAIEIVTSQTAQTQQATPTSDGLWLQLLGDLKALHDSYQSSHWRSMGDPYYSDHLLYQRLYEDIKDEIDGVAERSIGITNNDSVVNPETLLNVALQSLKTLVVPGEFAQTMLEAENRFLQRCAFFLKTLELNGELTGGIEDLLQGICSKHEEHVYLLSRRVKQK